jgi:hypothetical protein
MDLRPRFLIALTGSSAVNAAAAAVSGCTASAAGVDVTAAGVTSNDWSRRGRPLPRPVPGVVGVLGVLGDPLLAAPVFSGQFEKRFSTLVMALLPSQYNYNKNFNFQNFHDAGGSILPRLRRHCVTFKKLQ